MSFRLIPLIAASALFASSGAALAQTATATSDVLVRSGPGSQYQVLDKLPAGEVVNVLDCNGAWCEISMGGDSGFVARNRLDDGGRRSRVRAYEREDLDDFGSESIAIERDDPDAIGGLAIGGYYESRPFYIREGYYYWGGRWYRGRPGAPGWRHSSWRRWEDRRNGPGDTRGGRTNRPPRIDDRSARINRDDRGARDRGGENRMGGRPEGRDARGSGEGSRERGPDRGAGAVDRPHGEQRPPRDDRAQRAPGRSEGRTGGGMENRGGGGGGASAGGGRTPSAPSNDRGDRVGLDKAGGGNNRNGR